MDEPLLDAATVNGQNLVSEHFEKYKQETQSTEVPKRKPYNINHPFVREQIDRKQFETYQQFWIESGRDPLVLDFLLDHLTYIPLKLSDEALANGVQKIEEILGKNTGKVFLLTDMRDSKSGGLYAKSKALQKVINDNKERIVYVPEYTFASSMPQEGAETALLHAKNGLAPREPVQIVFLDDWSFTGDKSLRSAINLAGALKADKPEDDPQFNYHFVIGGVSSRAKARLEEGFDNVSVNAYYHIPALYEMCTADQFHRIMREMNKDFSMFQNTLSTSRIQPFHSLTYSWYSVPDQFCFPNGLTSSRPLKNNKGETSYCIDDNLIRSSSQAFIQKTGFRL